MAKKTGKKRIGPARLATLIVVLLGVFFVSSTGFYTDSLWFKQLGYGKVFYTQVGTQTALFFAAFAFMALISWVNLKVADKLRPIYNKASAYDQLAQLRDAINKFRRLVQILVPVVIGIIAGVSVAGNWQDVLLFLNATPTGQVDPQFHLDAAFYLFTLPFLSGFFVFVTVGLGISTALTLIAHLANESIKFDGKRMNVAKGVGKHVAANLALFFFALGADIYLEQYQTLTNPVGLYTGATYSDVNALIPGLQIMALISLGVGLIFVVSAFLTRWRLSVIATSLLVVSGLLLQGVYPWIVQTFQVVPNERTLESPFIKRNIEATRFAYGLTKIQTINYNAKTTATAEALRQDADTTANIRIIDPALVSASFRQLEQYRQYYGFEDLLDVDRYKVAGKTQDTVLAVRELNQKGLGSSQSWFNNTLVYTHGYGVVAAYGNQRTADGQPVFLQSGIPSTGVLGNYEPRIYFGESTPEYSIVGAPAGSAPKELDYPGGINGAEQTYTTFTGNGGPKLDNIFTKLAYAIHFGSEQILLSDAINADSQILYKRNPAERVAAVAPWLTLDSDPYPAIVDGRVQWIIDAYTTSSHYPYSRAENVGAAITDSQGVFAGSSINYIRNSVKATVDAYDGSVKLYAWDPTDPILKTWQKVFPGMVLPIGKMSAQLISHVRYPGDLFKIQRGILGQYHVTDPGAFYSQQDAWMIPDDPTTKDPLAQPPYYMTMQAPGQTAPSFSLYSTFIPKSTGESSRNVLTGYLVVDSDAGSAAGIKGANYGTFRLLQLPSDTIVPGPGQVQNSFSVDPDVSRLLNLLSQGSTKVLNGNLLTLPVGGGLLYVQPVYIQSTGTTSFPLLKKVLVAFGDKIAFEDTLDGALASLFGSSASSGTGPTTPGTATGSAALVAALQAARTAMVEKQAAMAAGDWTAYGKADAKLTAAINAALAAAGK
jgi:hypothetical protein